MEKAKENQKLKDTKSTNKEVQSPNDNDGSRSAPKQKTKRNRMPLSCTVCRKRKVKVSKPHLCYQYFQYITTILLFTVKSRKLIYEAQKMYTNIKISHFGF